MKCNTVDYIGTNAPSMSISIVTQIWISLFITEESSQVSDIAMTAALDFLAMILSSDIFGRIDLAFT